MMLYFSIITLNVLARCVAEHIICLERHFSCYIVGLLFRILSQLNLILILSSNGLVVFRFKFIHSDFLPFYSLVIRISLKTMFKLRLENSIDLIL